jgi:ribosome modulation factor
MSDKPTTNNDAFGEGYDAYWDGVDVSGNPYDEETEERRSWEEGWRSARKHDYDESEG